MSGLFGGGHSTSTSEQVLAGMQLQTSSYGGVIPVVYGTTRVPGNLIYYADFTAIPHTTSTTVGKGGGGSTQTSTTYTYTACIILALCEGPVTSINQVWRDKDLGSLSGFGFTFLSGTRTQTPWSYLTSNHPTFACGYSGMTLVCNAAVDLGSSGAMKNHSFEIIALAATQQDPAAHAAYDAKPSDIVVDALSNAYYGATWDAAKIGDLVTGAASYATYCQAAGIVLSPAFSTQKPMRSHLQDILDATNSETVWHSGAASMMLNVVPYGDSPITANGATYTPNTTPLYDLTYDDFLGVIGKDGKATGKSPITISRVSNQDVYNSVPVEYWDRLTGYNVSVIDVPEPTDVAVNGLKKAQPLSLHMITRASVAQTISTIKAQRNVYVRNQYTFSLGWRYFLLEPMDLVTLTDPIIGFVCKVVRILSIDIPDESSEENGITITAEEWPFGVATATAYTVQTPSGTSPNVNADPGPAAAPVIFDSPALWSQSGGPEVTLATAGGPIWGGCEVWASATGTTYAKAGYITNPCRYGTLTAPLAAYTGGTDQDNINTLSVAIPNGGMLSSMDNASAAAGLNLLWVDGEMISFQTATLTGTNAYDLTGLYRGLYGTSPGSHASGANWVKCDSNVFRCAIPAAQVGVPFYVKLVSYNQWGGGLRQISEETAYTFTSELQGRPAPYGVTIVITTTKPTS
jgi:hypothetical protein